MPESLPNERIALGCECRGVEEESATPTSEISDLSGHLGGRRKTCRRTKSLRPWRKLLVYEWNRRRAPPVPFPQLLHCDDSLGVTLLGLIIHIKFAFHNARIYANTMHVYTYKGVIPPPFPLGLLGQVSIYVSSWECLYVCSYMQYTCKM